MSSSMLYAMSRALSNFHLVFLTSHVHAPCTPTLHVVLLPLYLAFCHTMLEGSPFLDPVRLSLMSQMMVYD